MKRTLYIIVFAIMCMAIAMLGMFAGEMGEVIGLYCLSTPTIIIAYIAFQEDK